MIVFDSDDFGCNHEISGMCQSHDCRDVLIALHEINPNFKATLFTIPGEMTAELTAWAQLNASWIELAVHGFFHQSNYECEKLTYNDFDFFMREFRDILKHFVKGFKAPGWQISDDIYRWLQDNGWWVADQSYNTDRRPKMPAYVNDNGRFYVPYKEPQDFIGIHTHTWNCVGNGVYELYDQLVEQIKDETEFKFVSEVVNGN